MSSYLPIDDDGLTPHGRATIIEFVPFVELKIDQPRSSDTKSTDPDSRHRHVIDRYRRAFGLSSRETQVILLASLGRNCKEIACDLGCRPPTVDIYWTRIYRKSGCRSHLEVLAALLQISMSEPIGEDAPPRGDRDPASVPER